MMSAKNNKTNVDHQIQKLLQEVAEEEGFINHQIEKAPGSVRGEGYVGVITAIRITGITASNTKKTLNLIVKSGSKSDALRSETPVNCYFEREMYMYNKVIPELQQLEVERGLQPFSGSAKCYKACIIDKSEVLVLENLKERGYSLWNRSIPMEDDHTELVMSEYGRFHALSYALRDHYPERFKKLTTTMEDVHHKMLIGYDFLKMFYKRCLTGLDSLHPKTDGEAVKKYKAFLDTVRPFCNAMPTFVDEYSAILHGDCWTCNMMFKYGDFNHPNKPTKMCIIDLQVSKVGPPTMDLAYFLYACTSKRVIDNWEHYLNIYYDSLSAYLKELGTNASDVYPYSVFRKQWKDYAKFGLICSMLLIHGMLSDQNEAVDLASVADSGKSVMDAFDYEISNMDEFNDRVRHIILHFVKNDLI